MSLVSVITCTGFRPEAFKLLYAYMQRQTYTDPIQWIVVNDAYKPNELPPNEEGAPFEVYAGPVKWQQGMNTQRGNMEEALKHVKGDIILVMEDDECYAPIYIETMVKLLSFADVVGGTNARYYHLGLPGYKEMKNYRHASLCETGFTRKALPLLQAAVNSGEMFFDAHVWRAVHEQRIPCILHGESKLVVSMKGMPGRGNLGIGGKLKDYLIDSGMLKLREWLGADADSYLPFIKKQNERRTDTSSASRQREGSGLLSERQSQEQRAGAQSSRPAGNSSPSRKGAPLNPKYAQNRLSYGSNKPGPSRGPATK